MKRALLGFATVWLYIMFRGDPVMEWIIMWMTGPAICVSFGRGFAR